MADSPWEEDYWWLKGASAVQRSERHEVGEEFGIPNPDRMQRFVNDICDTRLDK